MFWLKSVGGSLGKAIDRAVELGSFLAGCLLLITAFITTYEVICRYIFYAPTHWTLDLSVYLLIWFTYISMPYIHQKGRHVRVDLLISRFSPITMAVWDIMINTLFLVFIVLLIYYTGGFTYDSYKMHEIAWSMWRVLLWPVKAAIPLGGILLGVYLVKDLIVRVAAFPTISSKHGSSLIDNPKMILPIYLGLIAISIFLYTVNGALGMVALIFILLFGGIPIFISLAFVGLVGFYLVIGGGITMNSSFPLVSFTCLENFALVCLPLYVFVAQGLSESRVSDEIYEGATSWVGHFPGGEAVATIMACAIFAAVSVSSVATAATIGLIALPALAARKYNKNFSYGLLAAGGTLGIMIPPSGTMIIYSAVTEESLGRLFMAGVIPGIILASAFIVYAMFFCARSGEYERLKRATWLERLSATKRAAWGLLAPVIILGGIYSGIFTPLESGAVACTYVVIMILARGKIRIRELPRIISASSLNSAMVLCIIVGAMILGEYMTLTKIPDQSIEFISSLKLSRWTVMASLMGIFLILGCFLEVVSIMMITLPIVYPLIISLGFDGIWFAVMVTLNMEMGLLTPPVGLNLFVIQGITGCSLSDILKGIWPFLLIMLAFLVIFALFPILSTWLPGVVVPR